MSTQDFKRNLTAVFSADVAILLDVYSLVEYQFCQMLGCLLTIWLPRFPLLVGDFRGVDSHESDGRLT